jgi:hypothetical protein
VTVKYRSGGSGLTWKLQCRLLRRNARHFLRVQMAACCSPGFRFTGSGMVVAIHFSGRHIAVKSGPVLQSFPRIDFTSGRMTIAELKGNLPPCNTSRLLYAIRYMSDPRHLTPDPGFLQLYVFCSMYFAVFRAHFLPLLFPDAPRFAPCRWRTRSAISSHQP